MRFTIYVTLGAIPIVLRRDMLNTRIIYNCETVDGDRVTSRRPPGFLLLSDEPMGPPRVLKYTALRFSRSNRIVLLIEAH